MNRIIKYVYHSEPYDKFYALTGTCQGSLYYPTNKKELLDNPNSVKKHNINWLRKQYKKKKIQYTINGKIMETTIQQYIKNNLEKKINIISKKNLQFPQLRNDYKINPNLFIVNTEYCKLNGNGVNGNSRERRLLKCNTHPKFSKFGCNEKGNKCMSFDTVQLYNMFKNWSNVNIYEDNAIFLPNNNANQHPGVSNFLKLKKNGFKTYSTPANIFDGSIITGSEFIYNSAQQVDTYKGYNDAEYNVYFQRRVRITYNNKSIDFDFFVFDNHKDNNDYMVLVRIASNHERQRKLKSVLIAPHEKCKSSYNPETKTLLWTKSTGPGLESYKQYTSEWNHWKILGDASQVAFCDLMSSDVTYKCHILYTKENENKLPLLARIHNVNVLHKDANGYFRLFLNDNSTKFIKNNKATSSTITNFAIPTANKLSTRKRTRNNESSTGNISRNNENSNKPAAKMQKFNKSLLNLHNEIIKKMKLLIELKKNDEKNPFKQTMIKILKNNVNKLNKKIKGF